MSQAAMQPDFEAIKQTNPYGKEYWSARDLAPLLGYNKWQRFIDAIKRAQISCETNGQMVADHFTGAGKMVKLGSGSERQVKDFNLSRFACYLIAQNGDPRKPEIAAAQAYFAIAAREYELDQLRQNQTKRLELRERISDGNKDLAKAAQAAGVTSPNFGTFHNAGYSGLYGGLNLEQIKDRKGIPAKEDLLDRSGLAELGANALRIGLTTQILQDDTAGLDEAKAIATHQTVGREIRSAIQRTGAKMPEDLPAEPSIKPLLDAKKRKKKPALPAQPDPGGALQPSLFERPATNDE